ncbi:MAG: hypothetical protein M1514_01335 [Patescibacteria group bacterium]|nr:hypothetical protein [Patescibacteria group bacterium]
MPQENEKNLVDVPEEIRKTMQFKFAKTMDEVLPLALEKG